MAKRLNVELGFTTNTSDAKKQINELVGLLQKIQTTPSKIFDDQNLKDASKAAQELQQHLNSAINTDTGKLDLTRFINSLNKSNTNLEKLKTNLLKSGDVGQKAFNELTNSISQAEAPMLKINGRLGEFLTTLKNSARWQISSNILHGFESALSSAYRYAQDLDESLNSIRIVTGQNADQMAAFAKEANEAAKSLSTTTTNYTDASLIYYQQGLSDEEVKKRTDITIKMGNAAQESAEQVSNYMTAIWENYYDGSEALESYADKITALGAATASSSAEIANGLNKFVSVGEQIGLSYDYATSALTTILAKTRQSEDVVGTALKTIFARIQGFNLGETADDGVTLNKYSGALKTVGVDVLDVNGKMKDMDTILDELAAKWGTLDKAQQNALAQTVAGVRQYTQLVALMDNWDFMKENLETVKNSEGALEEQQETFASGWEAARKRVKASFEGLYDDLIDEKGIIALDNSLADILDELGNVIDGFGGLYGILTTIGGYITKKFAKEVPVVLDSIKSGIGVVSGKSQIQAQDLLNSVAMSAKKDLIDLPAETDVGTKVEVSKIAKLAEMKANLAKVGDSLNSQQRKEAELEIELTAARYDELKAISASIDKKKEEQKTETRDLARRMAQSNTSSTNEDGSNRNRRDYNSEINTKTAQYQAEINQVVELGEALGKIAGLKEKINNQTSVWDKDKASLDEIIDKVGLMKAEAEGIDAEVMNSPAFNTFSEKYKEALQVIESGSEETKEKVKGELLQALTEFTNEFSGEVGSFETTLTEMYDAITQRLLDAGVDRNIVDSLERIKEKATETGKSIQTVSSAVEDLNERQSNSTNVGAQTSQQLTTLAGGLSMATGQVQSLTNSFFNIGQGTNVLTNSITALSSGIFAYTNTMQMATIITKIFGLATGGIGEIITKVVLGAVQGLAVAWGVHNKNQEEAIKKRKENLDSLQKESEVLKQESEDLNDLSDSFETAIEAYNTAKSNGEDLTDSHDNLTEATQALIDKIQDETGKFEDLNAQMMIASGNYDDLIEAKNEYNRSVLEDQNVANQKIFNSAKEVFADNYTKSINAGSMGAVFNGYDYEGMPSVDESNAINILLKNMNAADNKNITASNENQAGAFSLNLNIDKDNIDETIQTYEDVKEALENASKEAQERGISEVLNELDSFKQLTKWVDEGKEAYEAYTEATKDFVDTDTELIASNLTNDFQDTYSSREEYLKKEQEIIDSVSESLEKNGMAEDVAKEKAEEAVRSLMQLKDTSSKFANDEDVLDTLNSKGLGDLTNWYNQLSDEDKTLVLQIDFDSVKSQENLQKQLDSLKASSKVSESQGKLNLLDEALSSVSSGKPEDIADSLEWGKQIEGLKEPLITFDDFLKKTKQEQVEYLLGISDQFNSQLQKDISNATSANIAEIKDLEEQLNKPLSAEAYNEIQDRISTLKAQNAEFLATATSKNDVSGYVDALPNIEKINLLMDDSTRITSELSDTLTEAIVKLEDASIEEKLTRLGDAFEQDRINAEDLKGALEELAGSGLDLEQLSNFFDKTTGSGLDGLDFGDKDYDSYSSSLKTLAENYDNCATELEKYNQALASGNEARIEAAQANLEAAVRAGEANEAYDLNADQVEALTQSYMDYAESLQSAEGMTKDAVEIAHDLAVAEIRLNQGIEDLYSSWDDYTDIVKMCTGATKENAKAVASEIQSSSKLYKTFSTLKDSVSDLLDTQSEYLSDDFIVANMDNIKAAAEGDVDALVALRENSVVDILASSNLADIGADIDEISQQIINIPDGELELNDDNYVQALVWAMQYAGMAQDEIESRLQGMGITVDLAPMEESLNDAIAGSETAKNIIQSNIGDIGYDAELTTQTQEIEDPKTYSGVDVSMVPNPTVYGTFPVITGSSLLGFGVQQLQVPYATYSEEITPTETETTDKKTVTSTALGVTSGSKTSGGKISMANRPSGVNRQTRPTRTSRGSRPTRSSHRTETFRPTRDVDVEALRHDNKKKYKDETERYHVINKELDNINKNLEEIAQLKDRAFGKNKLNAMKLENKELENQVKKQQELIDETKSYLKLDKSKVEALGAQIGADGTITNYDEIQQRRVDEYNANIDSWASAQKKAEDEYNAAVKKATNKYNKSKQSESDKAAFEAAKEKAKETYDEAKKELDKFKDRLDESYKEDSDIISQYEETWEQYRSAQIELQKLKDQIYDNELESIQYEVEINVDISDDSISILEELFNQLGDDADFAADRIANLQKQTEQYVNQADYYRSGIEKILSHAGASSDLINRFINGNMSSSDVENLGSLGMTDGDIQALRKYQKELLSINESYRDLRDTMIDQVSKAFDEYIEKLDDATDKIKSLQKVTETYKDIIDVVGKKLLDPTGKVTKALDDAAFKQARSLTSSSKATLDFAEQSLKEAKAKRDELAKLYGEDNETVKLWDKQIKELQGERDSAYENWLDAWSDECEAARTIYEDAIESITTNFESKITGLVGSLDELNNAYERQSKIDEVYVDDYEKIYQLSKLSREINKSIDDTTKIKNKDKLKKLQQEINKAQEDGNKLSQYDLDVLQKKYELEVARQELEDSRNAKSKVTMQRDSEGNYGYVYTADSSAVADAEQSYEDKLHELQVLNSDYIKSLQGDIMQIQQDAENALKDFADTFRGTPEKYAKGVQAILDQYQILMDEKYQQMGNAINNNRELYEGDWKDYSEATGYKISIDADYLDKWNETNYSIITGYETMGDAVSDWKEGCKEAAEQASNAYKEWYENTDTALKDGGTSLKEFEDDATEAADTAEEQANRVADAANNMKDTYVNGFNEILTSASSFSTQYETVIQKIINSNTLLAESINQVVSAAARLDSETNTSNTSGSDNTTTATSSPSSTAEDVVAKAEGLVSSGARSSSRTNSSSGSRRGTTSNSSNRRSSSGSRLSTKTKYGVALAIINGNYGWGNGSTRSKRLTQRYGSGNSIQSIVDKLMAEGKVFSGAWEGAYYGIKSSDLKKYRFNTGGYTGNWIGRDGKMAILDKKEIVLNEKDTENFLSAINVVRDISKTIDLNASNASNSFAKLFAAAGIRSTQGTLQQEVHITAEFPNATDKNEILEAFDNVINLASQYSNRTR